MNHCYKIHVSLINHQHVGEDMWHRQTVRVLVFDPSTNCLQVSDSNVVSGTSAVHRGVRSERGSLSTVACHTWLTPLNKFVNPTGEFVHQGGCLPPAAAI